jgi:hypothetical protein
MVLVDRVLGSFGARYGGGLPFLVYVWSYVMVKVTRSRTMIDTLNWLYEVYCEGMLNDLVFNRTATWVINRAMVRRGIQGNFGEMRDALKFFEYGLDSVDPAYCYHMRCLFYRMQQAL